jgi:hypothetical protein
MAYDTVTASKLLARQQRMETERSSFEVIWQDIAERIIPRKAKFTRSNQANDTKGKRQTERIFDAVPALALDRFAAAVHSLVTPRNQVWHRLKASEEALAKSIPVQRYFEQVNKLLFSARYAANFDNQVHECYYDLGAFSTMGIFIGDTGSRMLYRSVPMAQLYLAENQFGVIDVVHRKYPMTARNAVKTFPADKLPDQIKRAANDMPEREFTFLSVVQPREDMDVARSDYKGMAFVQFDVSVDFRCVLDEAGHRVFPYPVSRYSVTSGDIYGRGPAELVLPDIKMLNEMNKTTIQAAQLRNLPPILAHRDGILDAIRLTPAAINYGGVDSQGRQLVQPMDIGGDTGLTIELMDQKRRVVQDAFWNTLFQILVDTPGMTATEAMLRAQEKGALLAPTASRIETEFLARTVECELDIMSANGLLPEPPEELIEAGAGYSLEYESPMARARRSEDGVAMLRTWEQLAPAAQVVGPSVYRRFNFDESARILAEVNGYPAAAVYTDDEMEQIKASEQQQQEMAGMLEAAPAAASAAKDLAQAAALSQAPAMSVPA